MLRGLLILLFVLALAAPAFAAEPNPADDGGTISIMKPEPGTAPAKESDKPSRHLRAHVRGSSNTVYPTPLSGPQAPLPVPHQEVATPRPQLPPPLYVPETGRALPNLPTIGAGPGGGETSQDKAVRCAHQAGVYGPSATGNPAGYIGSCINQ